MCELLSTRIALLNTQAECSSDLLESVASIIYCSKRIDTVPELTECTEQFTKKWGKQFVSSHINNASAQVNPRIVRLLSVEPPTFEAVLEQMQQIADMYSVPWKPNLSTDTVTTDDHNNIYKLGSVVRNTGSADNTTHTNISLPALAAAEYHVAPPTSALGAVSSAAPPPPALTASSTSPVQYSAQYKQASVTDMYPGTLRIYIHAAEHVSMPDALSAAGAVIQIQNGGTQEQYRTDTRFTDNGASYVWPDVCALFSVHGQSDMFEVEIRAVAGDTLIGSVAIDADTLRRAPYHAKYVTHRSAALDGSSSTGSVVLSTEYVPAVSAVNSAHPDSTHIAPPGYYDNTAAQPTTAPQDDILERLRKLR